MLPNKKGIETRSAGVDKAPSGSAVALIVQHLLLLELPHCCCLLRPACGTLGVWGLCSPLPKHVRDMPAASTL